MKTISALLFLLLLSACNYFNGPLILKTNRQGRCAYVDLHGNTVIPFGKYLMAYTDTFKKFAIVLTKDEGFVAIDRDEKVIYKVFPADNRPDEASDGLFRITKNGKIGYADTNLMIKIIPQYGCAFPFKNGVAQVSYNCKNLSTDREENQAWVSREWIYIDRSGVEVKK